MIFWRENRAIHSFIQVCSDLRDLMFVVFSTWILFPQSALVCLSLQLGLCSNSALSVWGLPRPTDIKFCKRTCNVHTSNNVHMHTPHTNTNVHMRAAFTNTHVYTTHKFTHTSLSGRIWLFFVEFDTWHTDPFPFCLTPAPKRAGTYFVHFCLSST